MSGRIVQVRPAPVSTPPESPRGRMLTFSPRIPTSPHASPPTGVGFVRSPARRPPTPEPQPRVYEPPRVHEPPRAQQTDQRRQSTGSIVTRPRQIEHARDPLFDDISELIATVETKRTSPAKREDAPPVQQAQRAVAPPPQAKMPPQAKPPAKQAISRVAARMMAEAATTPVQAVVAPTPTPKPSPTVQTSPVRADSPRIESPPPAPPEAVEITSTPVPVNYERERIVEMLEGYFRLSRDQWADLHPGAAIRYFKKPANAGMTKEETFVKGGYIRDITADSFYIGQGSAGNRVYKVKTKNIQEIWKLSGQNVAIELKVLHDMIARLEARVAELESGKK